MGAGRNASYNSIRRIVIQLTFSLRRRKCACMLSVTFVHPTQRVELLGNILYHLIVYDSESLCKNFQVKAKVGLDTCYSATYRSQTRDQSRKWQLIGMSKWCRIALCGHPLPALTDNWIPGAASRHTIAPISHTRPSPRKPTIGELLLISRPADGGKLSWPEHTVR